EWRSLGADLAELDGDLVSLTLVADPFGDHDEAFLNTCFPDCVRPFKQHHVVDLTESPEDDISMHHRREVRRALKHVRVEPCAEPLTMLDDWMRLHDALVARHAITGIRAFSRASFTQQLQVPGLVAFRALHDGEVIGANLVLLNGDVAHGHLMAQNARGYSLGAAYAMYWSAIQHFSGIAHWYDLGGTPGVWSDDASGLLRFKQGWTHEQRTTYLCGRVLNREVYQRLASASQPVAPPYFPAYRVGEFR
ncbi:MAG: GNAT family N-acetyltransferase, partial [Gemmatimonas sp.]